MAEHSDEYEGGEENLREEDYDNADNGDYEFEEDEEEEEEYTFRFKDGENPLDFLEDNAFGEQPYKRFERLEYEALANKKRKVLVDDNAQKCEGSSSAKKARVEDACRANMEEIMKAMNYGSVRRKSREPKKRGRQKGSKNKPSREVAQRLGEATLYYAHGRYEEAISLLHQIVLQAPHLADAYHTLGLVYNAMNDKDRALGLSMLAAHLMPKDSSLWKLLVCWSTERGDIDQANYCLSKAITADPKDVELRLQRASLYLELKDVQKAAESYEQIHQLCPENIEALKRGAMLYKRCGQVDQSIHILEDYLNAHPSDADLSVVDMLASLLIGTNDHNKALQHIEHAFSAYCSGKELPLNLTAKAGICHVHMGDLHKAEVLFGVLGEKVAHNVDLAIEVADTLVNLRHYGLGLKYYLMVEGVGVDGSDKGPLHFKIAQCYLSLEDKLQSIRFFRQAVEALPDHIDARLTLATLLLEENKDDEAILLLSPPITSVDQCSQTPKPWWLNEKVKFKICHIYRAKGMVVEFVNAIFPLVHESLHCCETHKQKVKVKKRLKKRDLHERVKVLHSRGTDNLFQGFRPVAPSSDLLKASRAKKLLQKKEEEKAKAIAAGVDWHSDDDGSEYEPPLQEHKEAPLPNILKDEEHHDLIIHLCKALANLRRYSDALEIISLTLRLANSILPSEKKEELRILGAQLAYNITEPKYGFDYVKYIVQQHPYSIATWNCYYKVISRLENRDTRHYKFLQSMQGKLKDCVPPILISAHHFTTASHHQDAARKYLEAYKLLPESPLINLCAGTALINLALGFRLQNKHQCVAQGLAFLYNNLRLCKSSQEALYNIARAYHHVGLVSLAASYYEKVLAINEKDYPIPKLSSENSDSEEDKMPGYCDLRREAAYNLHLIYVRSGATDLARQVLKDHCSF